MRVALAQFDVTLGDVEANLARMRELTAQANGRQCDLTVFPELATCGYDLGAIKGDATIRADDPRLAALADGGSDVVVGFHEDGPLHRYNAAAYLTSGRVVHTHRKLYLPNYLIWEERKHSSPGQTMQAYDTAHGRMATLICNDAWVAPVPWLAAQDGAEVLVIATNSSTGDDPGDLDTIGYWRHLITSIARMQQAWVIFVNRVGTESGRRFWGGSAVLDPTGEVVIEAPLWEPALITADIDVSAARRHRHALPMLAEARLGFVERAAQRLIRDLGDA